MWPFQRCLPDAFAAILHVDRDVAQGALNRIRRQWEGLQRLEQPGHEALVKDVFWAGMIPLVHESMCICHRNGWQSGRNEVKRMVYEQWAPIAGIKRVLEDVFGALKHEASRNNNCNLSRAHAFFEATLCKLCTRSQHMKMTRQGSSGNLDIIASGLEKPLGCARCFDGRGNVHHL